MMTESLAYPGDTRRLSVGEEVLNAVSHGVGALLAVAGTVLLVLRAKAYGGLVNLVGVTVFGVSMILLYLFSCLYHALPPSKGVPSRKPSKSMTAMSPFLAFAVDGDEAGVALGHLIEALLDIVGADLDLFLLSRQALVFAELDLGIHGNGRLEGEAVLVDLVVHDLDLGITDNIEAALPMACVYASGRAMSTASL